MPLMQAFFSTSVVHEHLLWQGAWLHSCVAARWGGLGVLPCEPLHPAPATTDLMLGKLV
jgi:hypothetical protein